MKPPERRCGWCQSPLPPRSREARRYCSTSCRVRDWHARNPANPVDPRQAQLYAPTNPKHYHVRNGLTWLAGHRENEPWFGRSCPPECPGLLDGETYRPMEEFHGTYARRA
jgi:hypothetical protein